MRYTASDVLETFPFPAHLAASALLNAGKQYIKARDGIRIVERQSVNDIYNRFHDRDEQSADIVRLRALHVEMDYAVAAAYGWPDLDLGHGFHETKQGVRYTLSESARRTILDRLLALNHQRYEEEVKAGLHDKKKSQASRARKPASAAALEPELLAVEPKTDTAPRHVCGCRN
jgi:hypothetical protein